MAVRSHLGKIEESKDAPDIELGSQSIGPSKPRAGPKAMDKLTSQMPISAHPVTSFAWREISFYYPKKASPLDALKGKKQAKPDQPEKPAIDKVSPAYQ